jgi:hypothetical protein
MNVTFSSYLKMNLKKTIISFPYESARSEEVLKVVGIEDLEVVSLWL